MTRMQETLQSVLTAAGGINTGAGEISQAADDLSKRTEQQAASLEETAAALEEITATVKKTAENARAGQLHRLHARAARPKTAARSSTPPSRRWARSSNPPSRSPTSSA